MLYYKEDKGRFFKRTDYSDELQEKNLNEQYQKYIVTMLREEKPQHEETEY